MTFKQKFKIVSLIFTILAVVCLFLPNTRYQNYKHYTYSTFDLITKNDFKFLVLLLVILNIFALIANLASISFDKNKYIPLCTLAFSLVGAILALLIKQISAPTNEINREFWITDSKIMYGAIIMAISSFISFGCNTFISIRSLILNKNDDDYEVIIEEDNEENDEAESDENEDESSIDGSATMEDINIVEDFKEKD